ncbi:reverse transcriptase domain-containing protein [Tanacetum coccineum]
MWESAKTVAPTPNSAIIQLDVDDNFVINSTHLNMIRESKFDGYLRADPHDHIREFLAICDMFKYGETQSEAVKLLIFPFSLCDEAKTWFNELNEESITSWEQMRKAFINKFFPPSLFNRLLLEIRNFSQLVCESLIDAWLRLKSMLRKCHGHGLTKGAIIQIFYHGLDEPTQGILDITAGGIFLYKTPNQAFQFLEDKVLFKLDWSTKSQNDHHQKSVSFTDGSDSNTDNSRFMEKLKAMDSQIISLNEELHDYQNQDSHNSFSHPKYYDPNDFEKSLTELNNDVRNDLEDFKRCVRSMRTVHWKLFARDDGKTTGVLPNKESKTVNQEPQPQTNFEKSIKKFLDGQRVTNMFFKNNVNDMILKIKKNENNFQTKIKNMERKIDEWSKSQNVSLELTDRTDPPPPPQAQTEQVNAVFTVSGKFDDSPKIQKDPPPPVIVNNKIKKDKPIKTSKRAITWSKQRNIHSVSTFQKIPYPQALRVDYSYLNRIIKHSLLVLRSPKYPKSKKNMLDEEEVLCQPYQANPKESHLVAVKRIFRQKKYLWWLSHTWRKVSMLECKEAKLCGNVIYVAIAGCCAQVLWIESRLADYDVLYDKVPIFCDNTSVIAISNNHVLHSRTKHIDIRYHFIRDHILKGDIELYFVPTDLQLADIFTKPLAEPIFTRLVAELGMLNIEKPVSDKKKVLRDPLT